MGFFYWEDGEANEGVQLWGGRGNPTGKPVGFLTFGSYGSNVGPKGVKRGIDVEQLN